MISVEPQETAGDPPRLPYLDGLASSLAEARAANATSLPAAARLVAGTVARDGIVHVFGSGHSQLVALELNRRAGCLAPLGVIFDPGWGAAELVEGYGTTLVAETHFEPADCLVAISNSGTTPAPVEIASAAVAAGIPVIAVTSLPVSRAAAPRHSSGKRLFELARVVLDTRTRGHDASLTLPSTGDALGPTSTLVAAALLHEVVVEAVAQLAAARPAGRGDLPIYRANAADGGREHNARLRERYRGRLQRVP